MSDAIQNVSDAPTPTGERRLRRAAGGRLQAIAVLLGALAVVVGLARCASESQSESEASKNAYKMGCPALDAAAAGGSVANQAAIKGLESLRDSGQLDPEPTKWVNSAVDFLKSTKSGEVSADAKKTLIDGCAEHGYPLRNLK